MKRFIAAPIAIAVHCLSGADGFAMGREGHQAVCEIAYLELSPPLRAKVGRIFDNNRWELHGFSFACNFPDEVHHLTSADEFEVVEPAARIKRRWMIELGYRAYERWHYINVPADARAIEAEDCRDGQCVIGAVEAHGRILEQESRLAQRADALLFLGHWIADLHTPMHVSFARDRGGNDLFLDWYLSPEDAQDLADMASGEKQGEAAYCATLHAVWDSCMILAKGWTGLELANDLWAEITDADRRAWRQGTPLAWANESFHITRAPETGYCDGVDDKRTCRKSATYRLSANERDRIQARNQYQSVNWPKLKTRIKQAGVRLAWEIEKRLAD